MMYTHITLIALSVISVSCGKPYELPKPCPQEYVPPAIQNYEPIPVQQFNDGEEFESDFT